MPTPLGARSDSELVPLARTGDVSAFAVLVHRHAPRLRAMLADTRDPDARLERVFVAAMRELPTMDPPPDVTTWLNGLASARTRRPAEPGETPEPLDDDHLDRLWSAIAARWPDGSRHRNVPRRVGLVAFIVLVLALSVLVPYATLTFGNDLDAGPRTLPEQIARPYEDEDARDAQPVEDVDELPEPPVFTFPDIDEVNEPPAPEPEPEPEPEPGTDPDPGTEDDQ